MREIEVLIKTNGLKHVYYPGGRDQVTALKGIDLEVRRGEFLAVIGSNGSGKSTLAKHFNALLLPLEGQVVVGGLDTRDPANVWMIRRKVGMVFQNPDNQLVATTVEEDVAFGPENLGIPPEEIGVRIDLSLRAVEMDRFRHHAPHRLSGGQKQRVAIAGVLAMRPECIVLDEATSMLDPAGRHEVMETVRRLIREEAMTVVHITHFMEEAVLADRVVVLHEGAIIMEGAPREVFSRVDEIRETGLELPQVSMLANLLRDDGVPLQRGILSVDEMVEALCPLF